MKILIAEDDPVSVKILQFTLEHYGHEVIAASDGAQAWELFDREPVRVVISDWMMPNVEGLELCQRIRNRPKTDYTYFILLTAIHTGRDNMRKAMDAGIDDFLSKPLDREAVLMRLRVAERILEFTKQIRQLKELIPICMYCKRVRDDQDYWQQVEGYIHAHTGTNFSHGICPECFNTQIGNLPARAGITILPK
ncbi:MAG: response regulator receiver protein [Chthoniobacteraceae bacterium]|nr:response regulator receiver protein [Chthoniobacteraceae bacterium]MDB6173521.1 response regulator receiver protein [Chthoniobacteraceae bacterium]